MSPLIDWKPEDFAAEKDGVVVAQHALAETDLFTDVGLSEILDSHPDEALALSTMGQDCRTLKWCDVERNDNGRAASRR